MNNRKKKLQGSVLFTVVFVMSILIVLLLGTLTLAYSTNSRAHVNYSSAQTGITSRLITESTLKAIDNNEDYAKVIAGIDKTHPGPVKVKVSLSSDKTALGTMGHGSDSHDIYAEIAYAGEKEYYDPDKKTWQNRSLLRFTSTVSQGGVDKSCTAYVLKHYKPDSEGGSSGGAGFVTTGSASLACQSSLFGGTYVNLPEWDDSIIDEIGFYNNLSSNVESRKLKGGNGFPNVGTGSFANSTFLLQNSGAFIEAETVIYGNLGVENWNGFVFPDKGKGVTVWGDMVMTATNNNDHFGFYEGENLKAAKTSAMKFNEIPFIYVNGKIYTAGAYALALRPPKTNGTLDTVFPMNIFCGSIDTSRNDSKNIEILGDIYCMDSGKMSYLGGQNPNTLYSWTASVINKVAQTEDTHTAGNIYSKGSFELNHMTINGDVRIKGDCYITGECTINGNLVVGGGIYDGGNGKLKMGSDKKIYCDFVQQGVVEGDNGNSNTKRVASKRHYDSIPEGKTGGDAVVVVENDEISYFEFKLTEDYIESGGNHNGRKGLFGEQIQKNMGESVYYAWKNDAKPYEVMAALNNKEIDLDGVTNYLTGECYVYNLPNNSSTYRARKVIDPESIQSTDSGLTYTEVQTAEPTGDEKYCYNLSKKEEYSWLSRVDKDGNDTGEYTDKEFHTYDTSTGHEVTSFTSSKNASIAPKANFTEAIYPKYAERAVLLGLEVPVGVSKSDSQVVKTIKEIKDEVTDPYAYSDYTKIGQISNLYTTAAAKTYTSASEITGRAYMDNSLSAPNLAFTDTKVDGKTYTEYIAITESCKLSNVSFSDPVVVRPGEGNILIIVDNMSIAAGKNFYVDDADGGNVYFYIEENRELSHSGNADAMIATVQYMNVINQYKKLEITPDANNGEDPPQYFKKYADYNLMELGAPHVYIFGGQNSKLTFTNMRIVTANIISPNIKLTVAGGVDLPFEKLYYDGFDTGMATEGAKVIFGCVNAGSADLPNQFRSIYVPDGSGDGGQYGQGDPEFWYRVLYYTEY